MSEPWRTTCGDVLLELVWREIVEIATAGGLRRHFATETGMLSCLMHEGLQHLETSTFPPLYLPVLP